ncbi:MAG: dihydrodipicolinate synthase family protein [Gammaproteobacteria bacterium]|nr:dihydrodipicolinate synthase family protein [Gammaproteobacteria bacterium]
MNTTIKTALRGVAGIFITPYGSNGELAPEKLAPIVERALAAGVHLPVVNGNTAEFYSLTTEEQIRMANALAELIDGRKPLLAGIGRSVADAKRLAVASERAGAKGLMIQQPSYPFVAPRGWKSYLEEVSSATPDLPIVLYVRDDSIGINHIVEACSLPNVVGVKWATPNMSNLRSVMLECPPEIVWVCGLAELYAPSCYAVGARGFTSGLINVWPERSMAIFEALERNDSAAALPLIDSIRAFEEVRAEENSGVNVAVIKTALNLLGQDCGITRPPAGWPLSAPQQSRIEDFLKHNELSFNHD